MFFLRLCSSCCCILDSLGSSLLGNLGSLDSLLCCLLVFLLRRSVFFSLLSLLSLVSLLTFHPLLYFLPLLWAQPWDDPAAW